jgi:hypothetical protein
MLIGRRCSRHGECLSDVGMCYVSAYGNMKAQVINSPSIGDNVGFGTKHEVAFWEQMRNQTLCEINLESLKRNTSDND